MPLSCGYKPTQSYDDEAKLEQLFAIISMQGGQYSVTVAVVITC